MKIRRLGYACINDGLNSQKPRISSSRTIRKSTYDNEGLKKVGTLSLKNLKDLLTILKWNNSKNIKLFRMSSDIFPWKSEWEWNDIDEWPECKALLKKIGDYAKKTNQRLTFHPGPFNKLCSSDERIIATTIKELEMHSQILDFMGFEPSYENTINIHIGASYKNKEKTAKTWVRNYFSLSQNLKKRLTVENDDKASLYDTVELYNFIYQEIGVPIMFDFHHHRCNPTKFKTEEEAANLAIYTWPKEITPLFHWSESKKDEEKDSSIPVSAHSNYCYGPLPEYSLTREIDLMIESKKKEKNINLLKYASGEKVHS